VAGSLGEAQLQLTVDQTAFSAGLSKAAAEASRKGAQIQNALQAKQTKVDSNQELINRLQKEALSADSSRAALIRQRIGYLQAENKEQQRGIGLLKQKLAENNALTASLQKQAAANSLSAKFDQASSRVSGTAGALASVAAAVGAAALFKGAIDQAVELESITRRLSNTLGKDGAGAALNFTKGLADQLGLSFKALSGSFASFTAAATGAGVPLQQQKELFAAVAKAGQALGLSSDEISGSLLALQQVASKGTVQMEELRGQLGERLPIAFAAAAKGLGVTQQELIKLVESGQLASSRFFPALTKGLNEMTAGAGGAETAAQSFQKLQNAWEELQAAFGQSLLPMVIDQVKNLQAAVEGLGRKFSADQLGFGTGGAGFLGIIPDKAITAVESLKLIGQQANLSSKEMRALWYDALKAQGIKNPGLANDQQIDGVIAKTRELAALRQRNTVDINAEAAESQRLLAISAARVEAEGKLLKPAQERLQAIQAVAGLEGGARQVAEAQLGIDQARAKYAQARAAADKASGQQGNEAGAAKLEATAEAAGIDLKAAMIQGGEAMKQAARDAADQLKQAGDQLKGTLRSNLDLMNEGIRKRVIDDARKSLNSSLATGRYDDKAVLSQVKTNQDMIDMATKLEGINASFSNYEKAQNNVAKVQEQLGVSFADLGVKLDETASSLITLSKKDWTVYVNGQGVAGYGDMVAAMNRGIS
jgi:tape measure domain-containing protein